MSYKKIFWGVALVIIGVLFILNNLGVSYFSIGMIVRLWPLLLIFWGVSLLPIKDSFKIVLSIIILAFGVIFISTNEYNDGYCEGMRIMRKHKKYFGENNAKVYKYKHKNIKKGEIDEEEQMFFEPYKKNIKNAELEFDAVVGSFIIGGETEQLFEFEKDGNLGDYSLTTRTKSKKEFIKIRLKESNIEGENKSNEASIMLNSNPVWDFNFDVGAASLDADLSDYKVGDIVIDGGAASIKIKLGNKHDLTNVNVDAGAASIKIYIPESSACEVKTSTFLSGKNFEGFNKIRKGYYQTPDFENGSEKIFISIDAAISGVTIIRY
ncbi:MAG: cell wall-active antibiotics response protein [Saprospiraceae bacterium]|nr:cell wall-active antibiotics response protein [Saprospiraceae bacterium]